MNHEDIARKKALDAIPMGPKTCDAGCGKPVTQWFGNTSCATCGSAKCGASLQREYDAIRADLERDYQ